MNLVLDFLISLFATLVGILIALAISAQTRPHLSIKKTEPYKIDKDDPGNRAPSTWLKVQVSNESLSGWRTWISWFYDRSHANACLAWVTFEYLDGHRVFDREMVARWDDSPEAKPQIVKTDQKEILYPPYVPKSYDIPTGESATISLLYKEDGDEKCYGWNNESYLYGFKNPNWRLEKGRYIAKIRVKTGGRNSICSFMVFNDGLYKDFRLEPVQKPTVQIKT